MLPGVAAAGATHELMLTERLITQAVTSHRSGAHSPKSRRAGSVFGEKDSRVLDRRPLAASSRGDVVSPRGSSVRARILAPGLTLRTSHLTPGCRHCGVSPSVCVGWTQHSARGVPQVGRSPFWKSIGKPPDLPRGWCPGAGAPGIAPSLPPDQSKQHVMRGKQFFGAFPNFQMFLK